MNIPFIDLKVQYQLNKANIDRAIHNVLDHGQYIMGPEVVELESALSKYIGVKHTICCSSGTDALVLPLLAKNLSKADAIFTSPFTFFATAEAISLSGATPVFSDITKDDFNMDPIHLESTIRKTISEGRLKPAGIMAIDLFGQAANYKEINAIAEKYNLFVIEDAAQSFGANYHNGKAGGLADIGATSFFPAKPLGCYGDGGAIFTNDSSLYDTLLSLRVHGQSQSNDKYDNVRIGLNARMDTIQAAILLQKLNLYEEEIANRNRVAQTYSTELKGFVKTPDILENRGSIWAQYSILSDKRDAIKDALTKAKIPSAIYYPIPIHLSTAYQHLNYSEGDFPISESCSQTILSLPMHPYLNDNTISNICSIIKDALIA